jgi:hypothetical protein
MIEGNSNVNVESEVQPSKYGATKVRTEAGIQTNSSDEHPRNACDSIRVSFDCDWKVNIESEVQSEKHDSQRILTDEGIKIDLSDEHPRNACE